MKCCCYAALMITLLMAARASAQNERDTAVRKDKQSFAENEFWYYDDLETAREAAVRTRRPLMIVFR